MSENRAVGVRAAVLEYLVKHGGLPIFANDVAEETGLSVEQVRGAINNIQASRCRWCQERTAAGDCRPRKPVGLASESKRTVRQAPVRGTGHHQGWNNSRPRRGRQAVQTDRAVGSGLVRSFSVLNPLGTESGRISLS
jgi:hypothetical protein